MKYQEVYQALNEGMRKEANMSKQALLPLSAFKPAMQALLKSTTRPGSLGRMALRQTISPYRYGKELPLSLIKKFTGLSGDLMNRIVTSKRWDWGRGSEFLRNASARNPEKYRMLERFLNRFTNGFNGDRGNYFGEQVSKALKNKSILEQSINAAKDAGIPWNIFKGL